MDYRVEVDWLLLQLMIAEHGPMSIDDLCGTDGFRPDIIDDLLCRAGRYLIGGDHPLKRLSVVDDRGDRLPQLVPDRARQRGDRFAAIGVCGESEVPLALDLGPSARATLVQEAPDQERFENQRDRYNHDRGPVFIPQAGATELNDAVRRQPALGDVPSLELAPVVDRSTSQLWWEPEPCGRLAIQDSAAYVGRSASKVIDVHHGSADDSAAEIWALRRKHRGIRSGIKARDDLLGRVGATLSVRTEGLKDDRRVRRKARDASHDLRKRQVV